MSKQPIGILGLGRFGRVLTQILSKDFEVFGFDINPQAVPAHIKQVELGQLLQLDNLFIAVPMRHFDTTIKAIAPKIAANSTVIDVCSVKVKPVESMLKILPESVGIIATHPLFGPDSIHQNGPHTVMMYNVRDSHQRYTFWRRYFKKQFKIKEMTPEAHDQQAANSQGITHIIGRVLAEMQLKPTEVDTLGFKKLMEVSEQTCNDTQALFVDLQKLNPYSQAMLERFRAAVSRVGGMLERQK